MNTCRWCKEPFDPLVPGTTICSTLCRTLEDVWNRSQVKPKRDPFLVTMEARADAIRHERDWRL